VICLIVAGKLFHTRGPANTAKLLSPRVVRVRGEHVLRTNRAPTDGDLVSLQEIIDERVAWVDLFISVRVL